MRNYNIGKIITNAEINKKDTIIGKCLYRIVQVIGGWEIYNCPIWLVGREWIDNEGNHLNAWKPHTFISPEMRKEYLKAYREYLLDKTKTN